MPDAHDLDRFVEAQADTYMQALEELGGGRKRTHWMWFMFPQVAGLGTSTTAQRYAIGSRDEAGAYLRHAVLGDRLRELTRAVLLHRDTSLRDIFGYPDDLKFCSSMTLFAAVADEGDRVFKEAVDAFCGSPDARTLERLR